VLRLRRGHRRRNYGGLRASRTAAVAGGDSRCVRPPHSRCAVCSTANAGVSITANGAGDASARCSHDCATRPLHAARQRSPGQRESTGVAAGASDGAPRHAHLGSGVHTRAPGVPAELPVATASCRVVQPATIRAPFRAAAVIGSATLSSRIVASDALDASGYG